MPSEERIRANIRKMIEDANARNRQTSFKEIINADGEVVDIVEQRVQMAFKLRDMLQSIYTPKQRRGIWRAGHPSFVTCVINSVKDRFSRHKPISNYDYSTELIDDLDKPETS